MDENQVPAAQRLAEAQRRRRDFIRAHHPDRGGDPDAFMAGLRSFAGDLPSSPAAPSSGLTDPDLDPLPPVFVVKRRRWPARLATAAAHRLRPGRRPPRVH